eukprot:INCI8097.1.p1 GENE.INCI8097.1~~INCI8097.1.p1  ORF type:complete len:377 (-),score=40.15 INCI8097.1:91-1221(-)
MERARTSAAWAVALCVVAFMGSFVAGARSARSLNCTARVGAIRWDDYYGPTDATGLAPVLCLSPEKWHYRLPFFAKVINASAVTWAGATPAVTDQEITYARAAGLDYWAFVVYDQGSPLSLALANYRASNKRGDLGFSLILEAGRLSEWHSDNVTWANESKRLATFFADPNFEHVAVSTGGRPRPLVYLMGVTSANVEAMQSILPDLNTIAAGSDPYYVLINSDNSLASHLPNVTAVGAYAHGAGTANGAPFSSLVEASQQYWESSASQGFDVIPHAQLGWDPRPRNEHPPPWLPSGEGSNWVDNATAADVATAVSSALTWSCSHRDSSSITGHVLIYAWNENTEGGWLTPTLGPNGEVDTSRLDALQSVLQQHSL